MTSARLYLEQSDEATGCSLASRRRAFEQLTPPNPGMRDSLQVCDIAKLVGVSECASKQSGVVFVVTVENIEALKTERSRRLSRVGSESKTQLDTAGHVSAHPPTRKTRALSSFNLGVSLGNKKYYEQSLRAFLCLFPQPPYSFVVRLSYSVSLPFSLISYVTRANTVK